MGFGVAGVIPFVDGGRRLLAQRPAIGSARVERDPVVDQIGHEMGRLHAQVKDRGARPEHVHAFAGQVRVLLAHARAARLDDRVQRGLGAAIDVNGREAVIDKEPDDRVVDARLREYSFDPSRRERSIHIDRDKRAAAMDSLLAAGVTPHLSRLDAVLSAAEQKANRLGAIPATGARTLAVQDCWQSWGALIDELTAVATFCEWFAPELSLVFGGCALLCEVVMYVSCWGG